MNAQMSKGITLHGAITLQSPMHSNAGFKGLRLLPSGQVGNGKEGLAVMSTVTMPLTVRGRYWGRMPIFPATTVVGAHRRQAAHRYLAALVADDAKISQQIYYALTQGQPAQAQMSTSVTNAYFSAVSSDLFFGMFGGASIRNASAYIQNDLVPITEQTVDAGMVPERFADLAPGAGSEPWQLVDYRVMRRVDDIKRGLDRGSRGMLDESDEEMRTEAAAAYQVIPAGISLYWRIQINAGTTEQQRGLLLLGLTDLLAKGQFGAKAHIGWGQFTPQRWRWLDQTDRLDLLELRQDDEGLKEVQLTDACKHLMSPAVDHLAGLDPKAARQHVDNLVKGGLK